MLCFFFELGRYFDLNIFLSLKYVISESVWVPI